MMFPLAVKDTREHKGVVEIVKHFELEEQTIHTLGKNLTTYINTTNAVKKYQNQIDGARRDLQNARGNLGCGDAVERDQAQLYYVNCERLLNSLENYPEPSVSDLPSTHARTVKDLLEKIAKKHPRVVRNLVSSSGAGIATETKVRNEEHKQIVVESDKVSSAPNGGASSSQFFAASASTKETPKTSGSARGSVSTAGESKASALVTAPLMQIAPAGGSAPTGEMSQMELLQKIYAELQQLNKRVAKLEEKVVEQQQGIFAQPKFG